MKRNILITFVFIAAIMFSCGENGEVTVVDQPLTDSTNNHYVGNRPPLQSSPLIKLPIGTIKPQGWLKKKLELQADGFHGHLQEISSFLEKENNAWLDPEGQGENGWEEVPYWLKGYSNCAYVLGDEEMIEEAKTWLNATINSQQEDGWFGPGHDRSGAATRLKGRADLWPNMIMLFNLQNYYEYSGDERVIELMKNYFKYLQTYPDDLFLRGFWPRMRAGDMLYSVYWLYNRTGEKWLLDFAEKTHENTADWDRKVASWHNVNIGQAFGEPAIWWMQSRDPYDLQAAERNWKKVRRLFGQVPGGMFGSDENCRLGRDGPRQAIETCGMVEEMLSDEILTRITGDLKWADRCENVAFNSLPAAFTADMKALRYLTAPNMPQSDTANKSPGIQNGGNMFHMNPHDHRCCQHNTGHGWPYYAQNLWYATPDNGLAAILYSASNITAKVGNGLEVSINENTRYPFNEKVEFTVSTPEQVQFPLYLRVPGWCENPQLTINGDKINVEASPRSYIRIDRTFADGDKISLTLPMELGVKTWKYNKNSVSVNYGPLTYSLKIDEKKVRQGGTDKWPAWEIFPQSDWNYGLVWNEGNPGRDFEVVEKEWPASNMPFTSENVPIEIRAKAKKIPEWELNSKGLVEEIQESPTYTTQPVETVTLVPMGAQRIRISAFPTVSTGEDAHKWETQ
ncbi:MAG: glycoside hydrolase family 127 protein [Bacteroidales bacterium]|nr:glycoside hydrolase family 127 protein [Bacteroidales bacterium]